MITLQIRYLLDPYLDWHSRVNLNEAIPRSSRVCRRFSKEDSDHHDMYLLAKIIKKKLDNHFGNMNTPQEKGESCYNFFNCFNNPRCLVLPMRNVEFKMSLISRLLNFSDKKELKREGLTADLAERLSRQCKMLIPKILSLKYIPLTNKNSLPIKIV
jgi:hypothetical protein